VWKIANGGRAPTNSRYYPKSEYAEGVLALKRSRRCRRDHRKGSRERTANGSTEVRRFRDYPKRESAKEPRMARRRFDDFAIAQKRTAKDRLGHGRAHVGPGGSGAGPCRYSRGPSCRRAHLPTGHV